MTTEPINIRIVLDDDQLLNALAAGKELVPESAVVRMLAVWRDDRRRATQDPRPWTEASLLAAMRSGVAGYLQTIKEVIDESIPE